MQFIFQTLFDTAYLKFIVPIKNFANECKFMICSFFLTEERFFWTNELSENLRHADLSQYFLIFSGVMFFVCLICCKYKNDYFSSVFWRSLTDIFHEAFHDFFLVWINLVVRIHNVDFPGSKTQAFR